MKYDEPVASGSGPRDVNLMVTPMLNGELTVKGTMKIRLFAVWALPLLCALDSQLSTAHAQGTVFTYQGRLNSGVNPANGSYDVAFTLYAVNIGGSGVAGPVTNAAVTVTNGLFTTTVDLGNAFNGTERWLELAVRTNGNAAFTTLAPRQALTPTPYAVYAANAGSAATATTATSAGSAGSVSAANITGALTPSQLPAGVITNGASGVNITGTFTGNGAGVTNLPFTSLKGGDAISWGNFLLASEPGVQRHPANVASADLNGDGRPDLITANSFTNRLSILINNGGGNFTLSSSPEAGGRPIAVSPIDVNSDGRMDLVVLNQSDIHGNPNSSSVVVLTNNGLGSFSVLSAFPLTNSTWTAAAADINGDGKTDLICGVNYSAAFNDSAILVFTNTGSGLVLASSYATEFGIGGGGDVSAVVAADMNNDGNVDIVCASRSSDLVTVLTNDGSGGFTKSFTLTTLRSSSQDGPISVVATDVNNDGKLDLVIANCGPSFPYFNSQPAFVGVLTIFTNDGAGGFVLSSEPVVDNNPDSVTAADVNADGFPDLISASYTMNTLTVLTNNGTGNYGRAATLNVGLANSAAVIGSGPGNGPASVISIDLNGDGKPDLASANSGADTVSVLLNTPGFNGAFFGNNANGPVIFQVNGSPAFRLVSATSYIGETIANIVGGSSGNTVSNGVYGAFIGGGGSTSWPNVVSAPYGSVLGGVGNVASGPYSLAWGQESIASGSLSIAMGTVCQATGASSVAMGYRCRATDYNAVALGDNNIAGGPDSVALGGANVATGDGATAMGSFNTASGGNSFAIGTGNLASGNVSTAFGLQTKAGGAAAIAMGAYANATNDNTFVWADGSSSNDYLSTGINQFCLRAHGGVQLDPSTSIFFGTQTRQMLNLWGTNYGIGVQASSLYFRCNNSAGTDGFIWYKGGAHNDAYANAGGGTELMHLIQGGLYVNGTFVSASDRNLKENFKPVSPREVLDKVATLPISRWNYKQDARSEHVGPMAQDFYAAFKVGPDDKHIAVVDESGVALAAIQGLNQKLEEQKAENANLKEQNDTLAQRLNDLEAAVKAITRK